MKSEDQEPVKSGVRPLWITAQQAEKEFGYCENSLRRGRGEYKTIRTTSLNGRRVFYRPDCQALSKKMLERATRNRAFKLGQVQEALDL